MRNRYRRVLIFFLAASGIVLILPVMFFLCYTLFGSDYSIPLPSGYKLSRVYAGAVMLCGTEHDVLLCPNVDLYDVRAHIVIGHVSTEGLSEHAARESIPGYFVLDTKKGVLNKGLSKDEWLQLLRKYGVASRPVLHRPSRFDRLLYE